MGWLAMRKRKREQKKAESERVSLAAQEVDHWQDKLEYRLGVVRAQAKIIQERGGT